MESLKEKIYNYENLLDAHYKVRRCKRYRREVLEFSYRLDENLIILRIYPQRRVIKKNTIARLKRKFKAWKRGRIQTPQFIKTLASGAAHAQDTASRKTVNKIMLRTMVLLQRKI